MNRNDKPVSKNKRKALKKKNRLKHILLTLLTTVMVFGVIVTAFFVFYKPEFPGINQEETSPSGDVVPTDSNTKNISTSNDDRKDRMYTFLLVGRDAASSSTDVIMLAAYDVANKSVSLLQIPRDTYINTDKDHKRINAQYSYGYNLAIKQGKSRDEAFECGITQLKSSVESTFGIPVDQYAFVNLEGFKNIVDIMGSVEVDIPFDMGYSDPDQDFYINLKKGLTLLDGDMAEQLIRYRQGDDGNTYAEADIGRIKMRKVFLSAMINKMLDSNISQMSKFVDQGIKHMKTDITAVNMLYFAKEALKLSSDSIHMHTAPGEDKTINGGAYYALYADETIQIINKYYNPAKTDITKENCDIIEFERRYNQQINIEGETVDSITKEQPDIPLEN